MILAGEELIIINSETPRLYSQWLNSVILVLVVKSLHAPA